MDRKKNTMTLIMMMGGLSGMLCFSDGPNQLIGFVGSILTIILFLNQVRKEFGFELLNCSTRFTKREENTASFRMGKYMDVYAIIFNSFIVFIWFLVCNVVLNLVLVVIRKNTILLMAVGFEICGLLYLLVKTERDVRKYNPSFQENTSALVKVCCFAFLELSTLVAWEHIIIAFVCITVICIYLYIATKSYYKVILSESREIQCGFILPDLVFRVTLLNGRVLNSQSDILYVVENDEEQVILCKSSSTTARIEVFNQGEFRNVQILTKEELVRERMQKEFCYYEL